MKTDRKRVTRLRREMGQETIWCKPQTSIPDNGHRKYPYLLPNLVIDRPDQVWCTDHHLRANAQRPRLPVRRHGPVFAQKVLGWALSNTMGTDL